MRDLNDCIQYVDEKMVQVSNRLIYFTQKLAEIEAQFEQMMGSYNALVLRIQQIEKLGLGWK